MNVPRTRPPLTLALDDRPGKLSGPLSCLFMRHGCRVLCCLAPCCGAQAPCAQLVAFVLGLHGTRWLYMAMIRVQGLGVTLWFGLQGTRWF